MDYEFMITMRGDTDRQPYFYCAGEDLMGKLFSTPDIKFATMFATHDAAQNVVDQINDRLLNTGDTQYKVAVHVPMDDRITDLNEL